MLHAFGAGVNAMLVAAPRSTLLPLLVLITLHVGASNAVVDLMGTDVPSFSGPLRNETVAIGREAVLVCGVDNLSVFKVAWLRVDTQTILTIHSHVITKNHRIAVTQVEHRNWYLHIRDVRESDKGWYMCQINTDPMKSQMGYLNVVVPPDILDYPTSADMVAREGSNISLKCAATGSPKPSITWRRESGELIPLSTGDEVSSFDGPVLNIQKVNRLQMGPYLCIASNGVPPSVSKRIMLIVHFAPMIWIQNQLVGSVEGQQITLECHSEAYPKSINYWTKNGSIISQGTKYEPNVADNAYKVHMKLVIRRVGPTDYGSYKCVAKNSLGETDGTIKLYRIPNPSTITPSTSLTTQHLKLVTIKNAVRDHKQVSGSEEKNHESSDSNQSHYRNKADLQELNQDRSSTLASTGSSISILIGIFLTVCWPKILY